MNNFENTNAKGLLKAYVNGGDFIARDSDGGLNSYSQAPYKCKDGYWYKDDLVESLDPEVAEFVKWEDERPLDLWQYFKALDSEAKQTPPTVKDVLLERYRNNTESFASSRVEGKSINGRIRFFRIGVERGYDTFSEAINEEIAYLNSPAEVEA